MPDDRAAQRRVGSIHPHLTEALREAWSPETAHPDYRGDHPAAGQCAVTAWAIRDLAGGDILRMPTREGSHYCNLINETIIDATAEQFTGPLDYATAAVVDPDRLTADPDFRSRSEALRERLDARLDAPLSGREIAHLCIRRPEYVAITGDRPEVAVFTLTNVRRRPIDEAKLGAGQTVYMRWSGAEIIARATISTYHIGTYDSESLGRFRDLTQGSKLFGLETYWSDLAIDKPAGRFCVIRLGHEEWIEPVIPPPATRSHGSDWFALDTLRKQMAWLGFDIDEPRVERERRAIPSRLRFKVLIRDGYRCRYCGRSGRDEAGLVLHVDHVVPWKEVREHRVENLVTACSRCNLGKGAMPAPPPLT